MAPNFWEQTRRAHQDSAILRLSRLYDPHAGTNSIGNLLETIRGRFDTASGTPLNLPQLEAEIVSISVVDPAVKKLLDLRNDYLAHRNSRQVVKGTFTALPSLNKKEINKLIDRVNGLVRKYRDLFGFPPMINL